MNCADLHIHSSYSDGNLSPEEIVEIARQTGLKAISITDHDCISSQYIVDKKYNDIDIIPGIELSSEIDNLEIHILGYFIDYQNKYLIKIINKLAEERIKRVEKIILKLNENGIELSMEDIEPSTSIGRSHIANAMLKKGYFDNYKTAFMNYLVKDKPAYVKGYKLNYREAIKVIREAGGIPVLAHPGQVYRGLAMENLIKELKFFGLMGLEVYHPSHLREDTNKFYNLAKKHKLIITGGSDYHGKGCYSENLIGSYGIKEELLNKLINYKNK
ncbi:PHP domain-containing protein [Clostridium isatidis]|uniref:PHP domain-containing protein n=1 Tax=Clostridium isatidis TaxID=182773 RepID=UPI003AAFA88A